MSIRSDGCIRWDKTEMNKLDWSKLDSWDGINPDGAVMSTMCRDELKQYIDMKYTDPTIGRNKSELARRLGKNQSSLSSRSLHFNWDYRAMLYDREREKEEAAVVKDALSKALAMGVNAIQKSMYDFLIKNGGHLPNITDNTEFMKMLSLIDKISTNSGRYSMFGFTDKTSDDIVITREGLEVLNAILRAEQGNLVKQDLSGILDDEEDEEE